MRKAQYTDGQFLDANGLNYISTDALASDQQAASVWALPGLINPSLITFAAGSGLNAQVTFGSGSLVQFGSGVIAQGLGVSSGSTSNIYNVDLTPFVPPSGSQVVNLYASHFDLPLTQTTISGPPPGNPAYNAGFVPFTAYQETVDSLAVSAMTGVPDGITQVLLASCTLAAGQSAAPTSYTVSGQSLASKISTSQYESLTANKTLTASDAGMVQNVSGAITVTLPAVGNVPGLAFFLSNVGSSAATLQANGSDAILGLLGYGTTDSSGPIPASSQIAVRSDGQRWQVLQNAGAPPVVWTGTPTPLSISASGGISSPYTFSGSGSTSGTNQFVPRNQADSIYAPLAGKSSLAFNVASLILNNTGSQATIYTDDNTGGNQNDIVFRLGPSSAYKYVIATNRGTVQGAAATVSNEYVNLGQLPSLTEGRLIAIRIFTGSGTYTPSAGTNSVVIMAVGGGGAGAGASATNSSQQSAGGGGSAGAFGWGRYTSGFSGVAVTIGVGGAGSTSLTGATGGTTAVAGLISCPGGPGGTCPGANAPGGFGGDSSPSGSPTGYNLIGYPGERGQGPASVGLSLTPRGGRGGNSYFGVGGAPGTAGSGSSAPGYGGGGGGASQGTSSSGAAGGSGAQGIVVIWEYA